MQLGRAEAIDSVGREVHRADGSRLPYDQLLIATGSQPLQPPILGIGSAGVLSCWTLADARAIAARVATGTRVLQMGAGFIGCIIIEALAERGAKLTVVEMGNRMVPRMMDEVAGETIRRWCLDQGVDSGTGPSRRMEGAAACQPDAPQRSLSGPQPRRCALMQITFKLFASLSDCLPPAARSRNALALDVADGSTVAEVIDAWTLPPRLVHLVLVNGEFVPPESRSARRLKPGDALAIWPPIAGG